MRVSRTVKALALAGAVLFAPSLASAATLSYQVPGNIFGTNGSAGVHISSPLSVNAQAGGFALKGDISGDSALESFTAWCVDITKSINLGYSYTVTNTPFANGSGVMNSTQIGNIQKLFNTALTGLNLTNAANSAGFQLALWELVYETGATFNVSSGGFAATSGNAGAITVANSLLAGLLGPKTGNYTLSFLESYHHGSQNLVTGTPGKDEIPPVPVPAAGLLLFSALGGAGLMSRLRRRATA